MIFRPNDVSGADELLALYELGRAFEHGASLPDAWDLIVKHLRQLIPSSLYVYYAYDRATDELEMRHATGEWSSFISSLRIPLGQRLSGWVAANRQPIMNSDPILAFGDLTGSMAPKPRSCLSVPLLRGDQLVGVFTFYSSAQAGFTEDHHRIAEVAATQIALILQRESEVDDSLNRDSVTGLPGVSQLERFIECLTTQSGQAAVEVALLFLDVMNVEQLRVTHGTEAVDDVLRHVVRQTRFGLRFADPLFHRDSNELVAVLGRIHDSAVATMIETIRQNIYCYPVSARCGSPLTVNVSLTCLRIPQDGRALDLLTASARGKGSSDVSLGHSATA